MILVSHTKMAWEVKLHIKTNIWNDINKINSQQRGKQSICRVQGTGGATTDSQRTVKIHTILQRILITEPFLGTQSFAPYFLWVITQVLGITEVGSTIIPILEMRKMDRITCQRSSNKKRVKTGFELWNLDSKNWGHNHNRIWLQRTFIGIREQNQWQRSISTAVRVRW